MDALCAALRAALQHAPPGPLCLALSGGGDSSVLLHALGSLDAARARGLRALHIDHGLHADSGAWARHCAGLAADHGIGFNCLSVTVDAAGRGIEAGARRARYAALQAALQPGELLLTAHHRDDQAETLLLRLLHGAGSEGLAGMRVLRRLAPGWLWRPLLDQPRRALRDYANRQGIEWLEDPANRDPRFARSWLREEIMPALRQRWPDAETRIAQSAARLRDESELLLQSARRTLADARTLDTRALRTAVIDAQPEALQRLTLGLWLDEIGLPRPPPPVWSRISPELLRVRADAEALIAWRGAELRRYRDLLCAMPPLQPVQTDWCIEWDGSAPIRLPAGFGQLQLLPPGRETQTWQIRPRRGGERIRLHDQQRSDLRKRLQEIGLPPWIRERVPLLCNAQGEVLAVGDLLLSKTLREQLAAMHGTIDWQAD